MIGDIVKYQGTLYQIADVWIIGKVNLREIDYERHIEVDLKDIQKADYNEILNFYGLHIGDKVSFPKDLHIKNVTLIPLPSDRQRRPRKIYYQKSDGVIDWFDIRWLRVLSLDAVEEQDKDMSIAKTSNEHLASYDRKLGDWIFLGDRCLQIRALEKLSNGRIAVRFLDSGGTLGKDITYLCDDYLPFKETDRFTYLMLDSLTQYKKCLSPQEQLAQAGFKIGSPIIYEGQKTVIAAIRCDGAIIYQNDNGYLQNTSTMLDDHIIDKDKNYSAQWLTTFLQNAKHDVSPAEKWKLALDIWATTYKSMLKNNENLSVDSFINSLEKENLIKLFDVSDIDKFKRHLRDRLSSTYRLKKEAELAAYRIASRKVSQTGRTAAIKLLSTSNKTQKALSEMLDTEGGRAVLSMIVGLSLSKIENEKVAQLAEDLRIDGMMMPLDSLMNNVQNSESSSNFRISANISEDLDELDLESSDDINKRKTL
jgi:hypothetical protein